MLPEHMYMTDLGKMAYVALYLPLVLGLFWWLYRKIKSALPFLVLVALVLLTLPFWDVYMIGRDAERLCREEGGLHVYKTVEAEGFLGDSSIEVWSKFGFQYVESGGGDKMSRYTMVNGKPVHQRVQKFISRNQLKSGDNHRVIDKYFARTSYQVIDIQSDEVLGELVAFSIYPGWWDNIIIGLSGSGSGFHPWSCGNEPTQKSDVLRLGGSDVVRATLKPKMSEGGFK
ncbi:hypothetical protein [Geopsychrobacter electrodiphilus]|uniref:hypothetical protein n=1 Tax=Geopsychrobacter electrodiphilus TaxID=225196 RepID=UPI0003612B5C|nr:hypothetical protein [Geopsychrobacter electrodiphilus]